MFRKFGATLAATAALGFGPSAHAATDLFDLANPNCSLATGCLFNIVSGNLKEDADSTAALELAYNSEHISPPLPATIDLDGLFKTPGELNATSGTFTLPGGGLFDFYGIKSAQQFVLYQVSPTNMVDWTSAGLVNRNGNLRDASHLVAYSSVVSENPNPQGAVPEPATWAMMLLGFGFVGGAMRATKRRQKLTVSYA